MISEQEKWPDAEKTAGQRVASAFETYFKGQGDITIERSEEIHETARVAEVQEKHERDLAQLENVVGLGPSIKVTGGKPTGQWCLAVLVEKKVAANKLKKGQRVPATIDGVPTDAVEVGKIELLTFSGRVRPAMPGYSIGHHNITAGTFGCVVRDIRRCCCKLEKDCDCSPRAEECPGD